MGPSQANEHLPGDKSLKAEEAEAILEDYPMPNCPAIEVPRLDDEVRKRLKSKGKDPHFGQEKHCLAFKGNSSR